MVPWDKLITSWRKYCRRLWHWMATITVALVTGPKISLVRSIWYFFLFSFPQNERKIYYFCSVRSQYINVKKLFKGGNYSRAETIWGNTVIFFDPLSIFTLFFSAVRPPLWLLQQQPTRICDKTFSGTWKCHQIQVLVKYLHSHPLPLIHIKLRV